MLIRQPQVQIEINLLDKLRLNKMGTDKIYLNIYLHYHCLDLPLVYYLQ